MPHCHLAPGIQHRGGGVHGWDQRVVPRLGKQRERKCPNKGADRFGVEEEVLVGPRARGERAAGAPRDSFEGVG